MPELVELQRDYGDRNFRVVGLTSVGAGEAARFTAAHDADYPVYAEAGAVFQQFGIRFVPAVFLVGPDGTVEADGTDAVRRKVAAGLGS